VVYQCQRISEGLKLAQTLANDKECETKLRDILTAVLCAHINEAQLISNAVVVYLSSPAAAVTSQHEVPDWSRHGVSIPIELIKLLSILKDHSRMHKDLYWRTLEDSRVLPFIAFALVSGTYEQVVSALSIIPQCAQNQNFPWIELAGHIRNCCRSLYGGSQRSIDSPTSSINTFVDGSMDNWSHKMHSQFDEMVSKYEQTSSNLVQVEREFAETRRKDNETKLRLEQTVKSLQSQLAAKQVELEKSQEIQKQIISMLTAKNAENGNSMHAL